MTRYSIFHLMYFDFTVLIIIIFLLQGYFTLLEYQRLEKGVDPEFMGAFGNEDAAQFNAYAADESEYHGPTQK